MLSLTRQSLSLHRLAAYTAGDGKTYAIKRIKRAEKQPRSSWGNAGVNENTRSF